MPARQGRGGERHSGMEGSKDVVLEEFTWGVLDPQDGAAFLGEETVMCKSAAMAGKHNTSNGGRVLTTVMLSRVVRRAMLEESGPALAINE